MNVLYLETVDPEEETEQEIEEEEVTVGSQQGEENSENKDVTWLKIMGESISKL